MKVHERGTRLVSLSRSQGRLAGMNRHAKHFVFGTILATSLATVAFAQSAEEQAVLAPIHAMFDGMAKRDAAAMLDHVRCTGRRKRRS